MAINWNYILIYYVILLITIDSQLLAVERYELRARQDLIEKSKQVMICQVGVKEKTNNNDGIEVERYLVSVFRKKGDAYCAAGQYYCFLKATELLKLPISEIPIKRTGVANDMFNDAKRKGKATGYFPNVNDLLVWKYSNSYRGHIERIVEVGKAGWVKCIGFNTSKDNRGSQDNGGGVYYKKRNILHPLGRMMVRGLIGLKQK